MSLHPLVTAAALAASLASAQAATLATPAIPATQQFDTVVLPTTLTDWTALADLPQFDPSLGTLQSVQLQLWADIDATARVESRNRVAASFELGLGATLEVTRPGQPQVLLLQVAPSLTRRVSVTAYDGVLDYAGSSGTTLAGLTAGATGQASFEDAATLALFTGPGRVALPVSAYGESSVRGSGNYQWETETLTGAMANVTYTYLPSAVPEPGSWLLLAAGLAVLGWRRARPKV